MTIEAEAISKLITDRITVLNEFELELQWTKKAARISPRRTYRNSHKKTQIGYRTPAI